MKLLRIKLRQNKANYKQPETIENKFTYPLPPFSTVVGAMHAACGYTSYHPMKISIQGLFDCKNKEVHTDNYLLNARQDDRGILVYLQNPDMFSAGAIWVAASLEKRCSFKENHGIQILHKEKMQSYWDLLREKEKGKDVSKELAHYQSMIKGPRATEVLYGVEIVLHIETDEKTLQELLENVYKITSIGRSEDFVEVLDAKIVRVSPLQEKTRSGKYGMYIGKDLVYDEEVFFEEKMMDATVYYLPKEYRSEKGKRLFDTLHPVCFLSNFTVKEQSKRVLLDEDGLFVHLV